MCGIMLSQINSCDLVLAEDARMRGSEDARIRGCAAFSEVRSRGRDRSPVLLQDLRVVDSLLSAVAEGERGLTRDLPSIPQMLERHQFRLS